MLGFYFLLLKNHEDYFIIIKKKVYRHKQWHPLIKNDFGSKILDENQYKLSRQQSREKAWLSQDQNHQTSTSKQGNATSRTHTSMCILLQSLGSPQYLPFFHLINTSQHCHHTNQSNLSFTLSIQVPHRNNFFHVINFQLDHVVQQITSKTTRQ